MSFIFEKMSLCVVFSALHLCLIYFAEKKLSQTIFLGGGLIQGLPHFPRRATLLRRIYFLMASITQVMSQALYIYVNKY